jgi:hypothetical protein
MRFDRQNILAGSKPFFSWYSETIELFSPTEPNRTELNMASRDRTEICFIAFE